MSNFYLCSEFLVLIFDLYNTRYEGVYLTLPPHIFSVQVKSRSMLHHGSLGASLKQNKRNLTLTLNLLLPFFVFHNKICVVIIIFTAFSFLRLIHGLFVYEKAMSVRLYVIEQRSFMEYV